MGLLILRDQLQQVDSVSRLARVWVLCLFFTWWASRVRDWAANYSFGWFFSWNCGQMAGCPPFPVPWGLCFWGLSWSSPALLFMLSFPGMLWSCSWIWSSLPWLKVWQWLLQKWNVSLLCLLAPKLRLAPEYNLYCYWAFKIIIAEVIFPFNALLKPKFPFKLHLHFPACFRKGEGTHKIVSTSPVQIAPQWQIQSLSYTVLCTGKCFFMYRVCMQ